jgi:hypothetical protein
MSAASFNGLADLLADIASPSDARQAPDSNTHQISPGVPDCLKDLFDLESPTEFERNQRQRTSSNPLSPLSSKSSLLDSEEEYDELDHVSVNRDDIIDSEDDASNDEDHFSQSDEAQVIEDSEFNELYASVCPSASEQDEIDLLSASSLHTVLATKCDCCIPCPIRANLTQLDIYRFRTDALRHTLSNGSRTTFIADALRPNLTFTATHHPSESTLGPRIPGQRARKQHFALNGIDVCPDIYCLAFGISRFCLRSAAEEAKGLSKSKVSVPEAPGLTQAIALDASILDLHVVQFVLNYAEESGAEKIPMDEDLQRAARFQAVHGSIDDLCILRLHECSEKDLFDKYLIASDEGRRYHTVGIKKFASIFNKDPRLLHIALARKREEFSECTICSDAKSQLSQKLTREQRSEVQHSWMLHLNVVWNERMAYVKKAQSPFIEKVEHPQRVLIIRVGASFHLDKMTKKMSSKQYFDVLCSSPFSLSHDNFGFSRYSKIKSGAKVLKHCRFALL